ncbi:nucleotidyltransferase family protein [Nitrospira sp. BLG_2]|uniref:nucleotidyltransferase family protein n=1 Tax=Nitrospira sp. BLG_2 TaxID=3397507 RepID=UPI003B9C9622
MNRERLLSVLRVHLQEMQRLFGVRRLALFGSAARDEMRRDSDVDILVAFEVAPTFDNYMDLKAYLERLLGTGVDLVTEAGLKARMRLIIEKDLVHVA